MFIGISTDGGTTINQVFTSPDDTFEWLGTNIGGYETISVEGDAPAVGPALLHSDTVGVNNASGQADVSIFVTRTDLAGPIPVGFFSSFTGNSTTADFTVTETTFADAGNGLWGGAQLATVTFTSIGAESANFTTGGFAGAGPFSVTHRYDIATSTGGSTSPTVVVAGVIPEPATWALMIMGFGGAGAVLRRRRSSLKLA